MGGRGPRRAARRRLRRGLAMDAERLSALSGLSRRGRRARRIQRQVHDQPDGPARLIARDARRARARRATATSSIRRRAGSSAGSGSWITADRHRNGFSDDRAGTQNSSIDTGGDRSSPPTWSPGLTATPKRLPPKYFYDSTGSALFERITELAGVLSDALRDRHPATSTRGDIAALIPPGAALIEFGSGSSTKTRIVLSAAKSLAAYVPVDISANSCSSRRRGLRREYPKLADASGRRRLHQAVRSAGRRRRRMPRVGFFPGSTIGNFEPHEAAAFLRHAGAHPRPRRDVHRRRRSGQGRAGSEEGLQRLAGRDREVQSQPAGAHQPRARRQVQSRRASSITPSSTASARASRCIWRA